ncbi:hypothetical protein SANTM175S_10034 [Streptomyces antimycoticus]
MCVEHHNAALDEVPASAWISRSRVVCALLMRSTEGLVTMISWSVRSRSSGTTSRSPPVSEADRMTG